MGTETVLRIGLVLAARATEPSASSPPGAGKEACEVLCTITDPHLAASEADIGAIGAAKW
jgi:hypothetical protein